MVLVATDAARATTVIKPVFSIAARPNGLIVNVRASTKVASQDR